MRFLFFALLLVPGCAEKREDPGVISNTHYSSDSLSSHCGEDYQKAQAKHKANQPVISALIKRMDSYKNRRPEGGSADVLDFKDVVAVSNYAETDKIGYYADSRSYFLVEEKQYVHFGFTDAAMPCRQSSWSDVVTLDQTSFDFLMAEFAKTRRVTLKEAGLDDCKAKPEQKNIDYTSWSGRSFVVYYKDQTFAVYDDLSKVNCPNSAKTKPQLVTGEFFAALESTIKDLKK